MSQPAEIQKLCPRCGSEYSFISPRARGSQIYYYAQHRAKGKRWSCYLGPAKYAVGTKLHSGVALGAIPIELRGALDPDRLLHYLDPLLDCLGTRADQGLRSKLILRLSRTLSQLAEPARLSQALWAELLEDGERALIREQAAMLGKSAGELIWDWIRNEITKLSSGKQLRSQ